MIQSFVFLDFETTGLSNPEVTEFCVLAVNRNFPDRMRDKLVICCSPKGNICNESMRLTGITHEMTTGRPNFSEDGVRLLIAFLKILPRTICLLAHNGDRFDFRILRKVLEAGNCGYIDNVYSLDTLMLFKEIDHAQNKSYKLSSVRERLFGIDATVKEHGAEADCETLAKCFFKLDCVQYIDRNFTIGESTCTSLMKSPSILCNRTENHL